MISNRLWDTPTIPPPTGCSPRDTSPATKAHCSACSPVTPSAQVSRPATCRSGRRRPSGHARSRHRSLGPAWRRTVIVAIRSPAATRGYQELFASFTALQSRFTTRSGGRPDRISIHCRACAGHPDLPRSGRAATARVSRAGRRWCRRVQEPLYGLSPDAGLALQARRAYSGGR